MMKRIMAAVAAFFIVSLTACGTITPPQAAVTTTETTTTTAATVPMMTTTTDDSSEPEVTAKPGITDEEKKQLAENTFLAEFYDSPISFEDSTKLVTEVMKKSGFESSVKEANGLQKITLKGDNGAGKLDVMCIDISKCSFDCDLGYIAETVGEYSYRQTVGGTRRVIAEEIIRKQ